MHTPTRMHAHAHTRTRTHAHAHAHAGMVSAMDYEIGRVVDAWVAKDGGAFFANSVIFYHADNGGPVYPGAGTNNFPLRGTDAAAA